MTFFILLAFLICSTNANSVKCPPDAALFHDNKTCYLVVKDSKSFADAESFCNQKNGNLAAVTDQFINNFLSDKTSQILGNVNYYWIGGTLKTVKANGGTTADVWVWTRGERLMTFFDWDPTATVSGNCTGVEFRSLWSAIDCKMSIPFVCEIPATIDYNYEFCDDGWTHFSSTHSCYKQFSVTEFINQTTAESNCIRNGGHLASIHSLEENQFIGELTSIGYKTNAYSSVFWVGGKRDDNSDNWRWIDNTDFDYVNWGRSYNYTNLFCVSYWPDYTTDWTNAPMVWNAAGCPGVLYSYLCKKQSYKL